MVYQLGFEVKLTEGGALVLDAAGAAALGCIQEKGRCAEAALALHTTPERLLVRVRGLETAAGRHLVVWDGGDCRLTPEGEELLRTYQGHQRFLEEQVRERFRNPLLTVDGIVRREGRLVLVRRGREPFMGRLALPGGIVEYGETVEEAVVREVREETGLETRMLRLLGVYSRPDRDPRGHFITVALVLEATGGELRPGDDAARVELVRPELLTELAFDHLQIVKDWMRSRGEGGGPAND